MPKAYWVANATVSDPDAYQRYREANADVFAKYGAQFLVRGGAQTAMEGTPAPRTVVIEFKDLATAQACYNSPEYQDAKALREGAATANLVIVEGYDP